MNHGLTKRDWRHPALGLVAQPGPGNSAMVTTTCHTCGRGECVPWKRLLAQVNRRGVLTHSRLCDACYRKCADRERVLSVFRTDAYRAAQAQNASAMWCSPGYRANQAAVRASAEFRAAASARSKEFWARPGYREAVAAAVSAHWADLDNLARLSESLKLACNRSDYRAAYRAARSTEDYRRRRSEASRAMWRDPAFRSRMGAMSRGLWERPEFRARMAQVLAAQPRVSSLQQALYSYLDDLGVVYHAEGPQTVLGPFVFDCLVPGGDRRRHLLIECQGDYWHNLPKAQRCDRSKFTYVDRYFPDHEIMYVWEHEFSAKDRVLDRLKQKLGIGLEPVKFEFGDVRLEEIGAGECNSFLNRYHYLPRTRAGRRIGARLRGDLVAVGVYSPPLRQNSMPCNELSRFCIHPNYHKKNFASWLVSRMCRLMGGTIVAYADTTVGHDGTMYRAAGFKEDHRTQPDYWYVDRDGWVMHKKTLYNQAVKFSLTESEYAAAHGYTRRWGGHKICYVLGRRAGRE